MPLLTEPITFDVGSAQNNTMANDCSPSKITKIVNDWKQGGAASEAAVASLYRELKILAARGLRSSPQSPSSLQPTELVHELFLKLSDGSDLKFNDRRHFYAVASKAMRQILIDRGRARSALKRGGGKNDVCIEDIASLADEPCRWIDLDRILDDLAKLDNRASDVVEMRCLCGMTEKEIALVLGVCERTIKRDWQYAKAWILSRLEIHSPRERNDQKK